MNRFKKYIIGFAALTAMVGFTACQDDFDDNKPGFEIPKATIEPNTTILEFKQKFWQDDVNYIATVDKREDGSHYIISGRVISNDRYGNVYKKLVIQDETAALAISINANSLYNDYRVGQEIVIDATDMYIGKYNGTQQLGFPFFYEKGQVWEATFMPLAFFVEHRQLNGLPKPDDVYTVTYRSFSELPSAPSELAAVQSQLVRFNNVTFVDGGVKEFTDGYKVNTNRKLKDKDGNTITVRTSGYALFREEMLPEGYGDVVAILDYYATSAEPESPWQLTLISSDDCMNFGNPTMEPGDRTNPYTVPQVISIENASQRGNGWLTGYIVGAVAPEVTEVTSNDDIEWSADVVLNNTLVIGPTADCKDFAQCVVVYLQPETDLRNYGNLVDHPENYGKQIWINGSFEKYMSTWGVTCNGSASNWEIDGVTTPGGEVGDGDGTEAAPYSVSQVVAMNPTSTTEAVASGIWVKGYIVGSMPTGGASTTLSGTNFSIVDAAETNLVIAPSADCTDYKKCVGIQLTTAIRGTLNLKANPDNLGKQVAFFGDVMKYCGGPGIKNTSKFVLGDGSGDTPTPPAGDPKGDGSQANPYNAVAAIAAAEAAGQDGTSTEFYVEGIVSSIKDLSTQFGNCTFFLSEDGSANNQFSVFRSYYLNGDKFTSTDQLKAGDKVVVRGKLVNYMGNTPQMAQGGRIISINGSTTGSGSGSDTPTPDQPVTGNSADFNTLNGGKANTMTYGTYKTAQGWEATWSLVLAGGTEATNFISTDATFLFPCVDGTPARPGKLTSPTISGGLKNLKFNYGFPYNETKVQFTVNIKQNGAVVASEVVSVNPVTKGQVYSFDKAFNVSGDFSIEIVNDCITQSTSNNKDRVAIWDLTWN